MYGTWEERNKTPMVSGPRLESRVVDVWHDRNLSYVRGKSKVVMRTRVQVFPETVKLSVEIASAFTPGQEDIDLDNVHWRRKFYDLRVASFKHSSFRMFDITRGCRDVTQEAIPNFIQVMVGNVGVHAAVPVAFEMEIVNLGKSLGRGRVDDVRAYAYPVMRDVDIFSISGYSAQLRKCHNPAQFTQMFLGTKNKKVAKAFVKAGGRLWFHRLVAQYLNNDDLLASYLEWHHYWVRSRTLSLDDLGGDYVELIPEFLNLFSVKQFLRMMEHGAAPPNVFVDMARWHDEYPGEFDYDQRNFDVLHDYMYERVNALREKRDSLLNDKTMPYDDKAKALDGSVLSFGILKCFDKFGDLLKASDVMSNCISTYRRDVDSGKVVLFYVEGFDGKMLVNIDVSDGRMRQCVGKYNKDIDPEQYSEIESLLVQGKIITERR